MPRWLYSFIIAVAIALAPALTAAQSEPKEFADSLRGGPDFWEVTSLAAGETLKMREAPSLHAKTVMQILRATVFRSEGVRRQSEGRAGFLGGHQPCRRRNTEDARSALAARKNCHANPKSNRAQKSRLHGCAWSEMVQGGAGRRAVHARLGQWTLSARVGRTKANTSRPPAVRLTVEPTGPRVLRKTRPGARPWRAALQ